MLVPILIMDGVGFLRAVDVREEAEIMQQVVLGDAKLSRHDAPQCLPYPLVGGFLFLCEADLLEFHQRRQLNKLLLVRNGALMQVDDAGGARATAPSLFHDPLDHLPKDLCVSLGNGVVQDKAGASPVRPRGAAGALHAVGGASDIRQQRLAQGEVACARPDGSRRSSRSTDGGAGAGASASAGTGGDAGGGGVEQEAAGQRQNDREGCGGGDGACRGGPRACSTPAARAARRRS
mmetsp:Transcript_88325/g.224834  ORF Transcript_88325/g.224834 Transcript_88325/m.224834 type:complete len:235 (+) Transcript_88325:265-969(+)